MYDQGVTEAQTFVLVIRGFFVRSTVVFAVGGLPETMEGKTFGVHVHVNPCGTDPAAAGGHYANPNAAPDVPLHDKEVWLDVTIQRGGWGWSATPVDWRIQAGDANSVVMHGLPTNHETGVAGSRLLCTTVPFGG